MGNYNEERAAGERDETWARERDVIVRENGRREEREVRGRERRWTAEKEGGRTAVDQGE